MVDTFPVLAPLVWVVTASIVLIRRPALAARHNRERGATRPASLGGPRGASGAVPHARRRAYRLPHFSYRGQR